MHASFAMQCQTMKYAEELSLYITINFTAMKSRLLFEWNMITCHSETKRLSILTALRSSRCSKWEMFSAYCTHTREKNIMSSIHLTSTHREVHVTPLTTLKPICVRFAFNDSKPATSDKHARCTTNDKRNFHLIECEQNQYINFKPSNDGIFLSPPRDTNKHTCTRYYWRTLALSPY